MHKSDFSNGGFVLHSVHLAGYPGRFSAWYSREGRLLDAEKVVGSRSVAVAHNSRIVRGLLAGLGHDLQGV